MGDRCPVIQPWMTSTLSISAATLSGTRHDSLETEGCALRLTRHSHLTYSRDLRDRQLAVAFDGPSHVHGTVKLIYRTWQEFHCSLLPRFRAPLDQWISQHAVALGLPFSDLIGDFETLAQHRAALGEWRLDQTPDSATS